MRVFKSQLVVLILTLLTLMGRIRLYYFSSQKANEQICDLISMNGRLKLNFFLVVYWDCLHPGVFWGHEIYLLY